MSNPTLDEKIAAVREALHLVGKSPSGTSLWADRLHAVIADLEALAESRGEITRLHNLLQQAENDLHTTDQKLYSAMEELTRLRLPYNT